MQTVLLILCLVFCMIIGILTILIYKLMKQNQNQGQNQDVQGELARLETTFNAAQQVSGQAFEKMAMLLKEEQKQAFERQEEKISLISQQTTHHLEEAQKASEQMNRQIEERMRSFSQENTQKLNQIEQNVQKALNDGMQQAFSGMREEQKQAFHHQEEKITLISQQTTHYLTEAQKASEQLNQHLQKNLTEMRTEQNQQIEDMRKIVDEKMQKAFDHQAEKIILISQQTTQHLSEARNASEQLNRQTEERMRSFSQENAQKLNQIEQNVQKNLTEMRSEQNQQIDDMRKVVDEKMQQAFSGMREEQKQAFHHQEEKIILISQQTTHHLEEAQKASDQLNRQTEERMRSFSQENAQKLNQIEQSVQKNLVQMRTEQNQQLDDMRKVVDEKMQKVLNERMQQAFSSVNERLEQVHKGLGEMQNLAGSVGDLKKLLTNVKTRGEIGEIQLENLLADILSENQYLTNAKIGSGIVEFAVRIPDTKDGETLLPIDAKFPGDTYRHLQEAYETGDKQLIQSAQKVLAERIRSEAQDIQKKYINPPATTDFGILFLPTEGLYTEAVRNGLTEEIFRKYRVFVTSPSTLAAMLMTLQIGFRSVAVQKHSNEVWQVLGEVRTEFNKFADALSKTQDKLSSASKELENLVGTRTRQMNRKLNYVQHYLAENDSDQDN